MLECGEIMGDVISAARQWHDPRQSLSTVLGLREPAKGPMKGSPSPLLAMLFAVSAFDMQAPR
jgi:hypothetical protein